MIVHNAMKQKLQAYLLLNEIYVEICKARRGEARRGEARRGEARRGEARRGEARRGEARRGEARRGEAIQDVRSHTDLLLVQYSL